MDTRLDVPIPDFRPLAEALRLTARLAALESQTTLLQFAVWRALRRRRNRYHALRQQIEGWSARHRTGEIDPDDALTDDLLALQQEIRVALTALETAPAPWRPWQRWVHQRTARELLAIHRLLGGLRTWILEHDADRSPVPDEAFDSAEALIAALKRDAAR